MDEMRRACRRVAANIEIIYQDSGAPVNSYILNVGGGGIFIKTENPPPIDSKLSLRFHLPDNHEPLNIEGRVVWVKQKANSFPTGMGVKFADMSPVHMERIRAYVESQM
jgi:uncharacterized protein (TIGR02266 family)